MKIVYSIIALLLVAQVHATIRRVRVGNATPGTGGTWASAYTNLQTAINASASGDEVWVAVPVSPAQYQLANGVSYNMKQGVRIYGGFAGNELTLASRNITVNVTTLIGSGQSVVRCANELTATALLDGFTIAGGYNSFGGGIDCAGASATFSNLILRNNHAQIAGGGFYSFTGSPTLTNIVFYRNTADGSNGSEGVGGGMYNEESYPTVTNAVFHQNSALREGGAISTYSTNYTNTRKPILTNVLFSQNEAENGAGGAIFGTETSYIITNCTFVSNTSSLANGGSAMHNIDPSSASVSLSTLKNCLFYENYVSPNFTLSDVVNAGSATTAITYSMLVAPPAGGNNVAPSGAVPFVSTNDYDGPDDIWMTADDGYRLNNCNGLVIDKGNNTGIPSTDIAGQPRRVDMGYVADGGLGSAPLVDLGAYENQATATVVQLTGTIGGEHTIPTPQELAVDYVTSVTSPAAGMTIKWQSSTDNINWVTASPASSAATYTLPALTQTTWYRRTVKSVAYCNTDIPGNTIRIKVVEPNGRIIGQVISVGTASTGVNNVSIRIKRIGRTPVSGTDTNYVYTGITDGAGYYTIEKIYYGDPTLTGTKDTFRVMPQRPNHKFNPASFDKILTQSNPQPITPVDFIDTTVLSITGRTFQPCTTCNDETGALITLKTCELDSVAIYKNNDFNSYTRQIGAAFGQYGVTVLDPVQLTIDPRYNSHSFSPAFRTFTPTDNVTGQDFSDTTTRTISGYFTAGCNEYIGTAVLEFSDILPNDNAGNPRSSCFRKRVTTNMATGFFTIRLPARKYRVKVINFTAANLQANTVFETDIKDFFNNRITDSLIRDITITNKVLNLTFEREPQLRIMAGLDTICSGTNRGFAIFRQAFVDSFRVKVFQGSPLLIGGSGCPVTDTINQIKVFTSIQSGDNSNQQINFKPRDTGIVVRLKGGTPNIIAPHYKILNIQYTDRLNRSTASLNKNVVVTGIKTDVATFTTVSPQIPMLILHDPPGDNSFSTWMQTQSIQSAFRMFAASGTDVNVWLQAKIGAKFEAGLGVSTENSVWGTIGGNINIGSRNTTGDETILTTTTSSNYATSSNPSVTGTDGDVFIGAALNLIYAGSTEVTVKNCVADTARRLVVADNGFATQYVYTEMHIRNNIIPGLRPLVQSAVTQGERDSIQNQISVWEQVLDNNARNRANAAYDKNISFDGASGPITNTTTSSVSKSNTVEFSMNIDGGLAVELGFEVAGSGASGGVNVDFKTETGSTTTGTALTETVISYTLDDDDNGDYFSVNVKKDPVYSTPVFELAAATASCPAEPGAQPRDEKQLTIPVPSVSNISAGDEAQFILRLGNTSQSQETRTYQLSFDQSSNPDGAIVTIGGSPVGSTAISYPIAYLGEVQVTVSVRKPNASTVFSFEGLRFVMTDACGGDTLKGLISAHFISPCSGVNLAEPENNWVVKASANNLLELLIKDYNVPGLTTVTVEYSPAGTSSWTTAFTKLASELNPNGTNGTTVDWNVQSLADGGYNIRLKLNCTQGVVYSQRASGIIDRNAPLLYGNPQPTDETYVAGDIISFSYNEKIRVPNLLDSNVTMRRLSNNQLIPVTITGFENKIIITPNTGIANLTGDSLRVIVKNMQDEHGNASTVRDTMHFTIGSSLSATGPTVLNLSVGTPSGNRMSDSAAWFGVNRNTGILTAQVVYKNSDSTIKIHFNLPANATNLTRVNYFISGTAKLGIDYTIAYVGSQPAGTSFNGAQGTIFIPAGSKRATLIIDPISNYLLEPDKTIVVNLNEGGDYLVGSTHAVSGIITSEDNISIYTFTGTGNFDVLSNWLNGKRPLQTLVAGKQIIINPTGGPCNLNVPQSIRTGSTLTIKTGKEFIVPSVLKQP